MNRIGCFKPTPHKKKVELNNIFDNLNRLVIYQEKMQHTLLFLLLKCQDLIL